MALEEAVKTLETQHENVQVVKVKTSKLEQKDLPENRKVVALILLFK